MANIGTILPKVSSSDVVKGWRQVAFPRHISGGQAPISFTWTVGAQIRRCCELAASKCRVIHGFPFVVIYMQHMICIISAVRSVERTKTIAAAAKSFSMSREGRSLDAYGGRVLPMFFFLPVCDTRTQLSRV